MSSLGLLWLVSLFISGVAIVIMVALVAARGISETRKTVQAAERARLVPLLLGVGRNDDTYSEVEPASDLLTELSTELIQMVRGTDMENFVASSSRLGVPERLRQRLDAGSPRIRLAAAEALAHYGDERSTARLLKALDDSNPDVRLASAMALASAGQAPPVDVIIEKLGIGTQENSMLVVGLFKEIARERPDELRALIEDKTSNGIVKAAAIDALSTSGDYGLVPVIAGLVLNAEPSAKELPRYLRALGEFGHPAAAVAVEHALWTDVWWVRAAAAEAAGRIGLDHLAMRLTELLDDTNWWVRFRAGEALTRLGDTGLRLLRETALGGRETARTTARLTLAEKGLAA